MSLLGFVDRDQDYSVLETKSQVAEKCVTMHLQTEKLDAVTTTIENLEVQTLTANELLVDGTLTTNITVAGTLGTSEYQVENQTATTLRYPVDAVPGQFLTFDGPTQTAVWRAGGTPGAPLSIISGNGVIEGTSKNNGTTYAITPSASQSISVDFYVPNEVEGHWKFYIFSPPTGSATLTLDLSSGTVSGVRVDTDTTTTNKTQISASPVVFSAGPSSKTSYNIDLIASVISGTLTFIVSSFSNAA